MRPPMKSMFYGIVTGSLGVTLFGADPGMALAPLSAIDPVASPLSGLERDDVGLNRIGIHVGVIF